ncbi:MAG: hypothetical protein NW214_14545 [Pseudanabaenaceae cyanobacterium bins.39]|nr:hypothetical protein [Pseudanabaenaceae cyanobacterium bins.39]
MFTSRIKLLGLVALGYSLISLGQAQAANGLRETSILSCPTLKATLQWLHQDGHKGS